MKKKTIFKMFLIPLTAVMLVQAIATYGSLLLGGTAEHLDDYSVGITDQIVKNRNLILENNMLHRWSDISGESLMANALLSGILEKKELQEEDFLSDEGAKRELLEQMLDPSIAMLRRGGVNGVYLILADGMQNSGQKGQGGEQGTKKCSGIYFRDSDATVNPRDNSDLLMERGEFAFSHELDIPFDTVWTSKFNLKEERAQKDDAFFYQPYRAALANPGAKAEDLGYWGKTFCLEGNREADGYQMISYSMPLISDSGAVYGVLGVEISLAALDRLMPEDELNSGQHSGYILAEYDEGGALVPFYEKGTSIKRNVELSKALLLETTQYSSLYKLEGTGGSSGPYYADIVPFGMYTPNTPFVNNGWVLAGVQNEDTLFGIGDRIMKTVLLVIMSTLLLGIVCLYALMGHLTKPIRELAKWIRNVKKNTVKDYKTTDIAEIDDLYEAVYDLIEKQKNAEYAAVEEKERYLLALQSSTDIIFTYNVADDSIDIFNLSAGGDSGAQESHQAGLLESIRGNNDIHDVDRQMMERMFARLDKEFKMHFRIRSEKSDWQWMELSGKTICNDAGTKIKVIGSIRNINEQKVREQMENKATRLDSVTGLYREEIGQRIITAEVEMGRSGYLIFMDFDKFRELNEQFGIDFGDAVLEEVGNFIVKLKHELEKSGRHMVPVRVGGDEIIAWLRGVERSEVEVLFERFYSMLRQLYQDENFGISITSAALFAAGEQISYKDLTNRLGLTMMYCKRRRMGLLTFCSDIADADLMAETGELYNYKEIASTGNVRTLSLMTKAFNLFERGSQVAPVIAILFAKLGDSYRARDIYMTEIRWDFNTSVVSRQWHAAEDAVLDKEICHFTGDVIYGLSEKLGAGAVCFEADSTFDSEERKLLHIPLGLSGLCVPLYDNRKLMGAISFLQRSEHEQWNEEKCNELQEVVRIIETNVNKERYDLASRAKSDFLSRMSHEIRTPMNAIIGMTAIALEKKSESGAVEECLHKIDRSSQYLLSLINDILDMSKIESGKMKLALEDGSIKDMVDEIDDLMAAQIKEKEITYVREFYVKNQWIHADFMRLKQVVINLLGNAVKFTPRGGSITFIVTEKSCGALPVSKQGTDSAETEIYFAVEDTGIGINEENRERIFNAFEQAENTTALAYGGTGLGLSISSRLVRMMGGDIGLNSTDGKGSCFFFKLCFHKAQMQEEEEEMAQDPQERDFTDCRVLLVEDNELNTEIAKTILEMHGFIVETAENGLEGVEKFRDSPPLYYDLILMDIRMPVMDGLEASKTIRRMDKADAQSVPIIAMTANAFDEDMKKSVECGMNGHLAKPMDVKKMMRTAGAVMKKASEKNLSKKKDC